MLLFLTVQVKPSEAWSEGCATLLLVTTTLIGMSIDSKIWRVLDLDRQKEIIVHDNPAPANGFWDIWKRNTVAQPDIVMTISPTPTSWARNKKYVYWIPERTTKSVLKTSTKVRYLVLWPQAWWWTMWKKDPHTLPGEGCLIITAIDKCSPEHFMDT